jgi:hypothetical protein
LIQSAKPASLHTQTTKECHGKRSLNGIMAIISKIWSQSALKHDLSLRCLVLDAVRRRQSAHWRWPAHAPSACQGLPSVALARAFKTSPGRASPHPVLTLVGQTSLLSSSELSSARASATASAHSSHVHVAPAPRLASLVARGAFQALGPDRTSPETRDHLRRTSVARGRAWTEQSGEPF